MLLEQELPRLERWRSAEPGLPEEVLPEQWQAAPELELPAAVSVHWVWACRRLGGAAPVVPRHSPCLAAPTRRGE